MALVLLKADRLPPFLAWCPPWLAAAIAAGLGVCVVAVDRWRTRRNTEIDRDQAAIDRLRQHGGRLKTLLPQIGSGAATGLALRVHPALPSRATSTAATPSLSWRPWRRRPTDAGDLQLPTFVERTKGAEIRQRLREARAKGGVLLLVGDSCVGKTRMLYESARRELPDFAVLVPDLGDGDLINTVAQASFRLPKLIIWLDELQRFLPGPYLGEGATAVTAASIRRLLDAPTPVIVLGTLWPAYAQTLRSVTIDPDHPGERRPRYPGAVDILTDSRVHETRLDPFNSAERATAAALAAQDPTLAAAVADRDYNVTEALMRRA